MELLETNNPKKDLLLREAAQHKSALEGDLKILSEKADKILTNSLIIGGALALSYFVASQFFKSKKKVKSKSKKVAIVKDHPSEVEEYEQESSIVLPILSQIGSAVASQATALLLTLAKEKLTEYLASQKKKEDGE